MPHRSLIRNVIDILLLSLTIEVVSFILSQKGFSNRRSLNTITIAKGTPKRNTNNVHYKNCTLYSDNVDSFFGTAERKIFNPKTKRYIKQTSVHKKRSSRWQTIMYKEGGYISYCGVLVPIDLRLLAIGKNDESRRNRNRNRNSTVTVSDKEEHNHSTINLTINLETLKENRWNQVSPTVKIGEDICPIEQESNSMEFPMIDQLFFCHKPPRLLTLPGIGPEKADCLASRVKKWLWTSEEGKTMMTTATISSERSAITMKIKKRARKKKKRIKFEPRPCHRLDFDTSGVICIALSPQAHYTTSMLFEKRMVQKTYVALVAGHLLHDSGQIDFPVGKVYNKKRGFNEFACIMQQQGKEGSSDNIHNGRYLNEADFDGTLRDAMTDYTVSRRFTVPLQDDRGEKEAKYTRVLLSPRTGRGHQLRLHMKAIGHSILGDQLHAPKHIADCTPCLCLHAETIQMPSRNVYVDNSTTDAKMCQVVAHQIAPF